MKNFIIFLLLLLPLLGYTQDITEVFGGRFTTTVSTDLGSDKILISGVFKHSRNVWKADSIQVGDFLIDCDCNAFVVDSIYSVIDNAISMRVEAQDPSVTRVKLCTGGIVRSVLTDDYIRFPNDLPTPIIDCILNHNYSVIPDVSPVDTIFASGDTLSFVTVGGDTVSVVIPSTVSIDSISYWGDSLRIYEAGAAFSTEIITTDTSGYNISVYIVNDTLYIQDASGTQAASLAAYLDNVDTSGYNRAFYVAGKTLYIVDDNDTLSLDLSSSIGSGLDNEVAVWDSDTLKGYASFTYNGTNLIANVTGYVSLEGDFQANMQSDSGNVILISHQEETGKTSRIEIANNEIVINADSIQILGGIPGAPDSLLGIAGTLLRFASIASINAGASIDSISYYGDTLRIYEGGDINAFKVEIVAGAGIDTSGYNQSFYLQDDTLFLVDGDTTVFVYLAGFMDNTDDQKIDTFGIVNDTLQLSLEDDGEPFKFIDLSAYLDNTDTSGYNISLSVSNDTLFITDGDSTLWVDLSGIGDNLGNHEATQDLNMNFFGINEIDTLEIGSQLDSSSVYKIWYDGDSDYLWITPGINPATNNYAIRIDEFGVVRLGGTNGYDMPDSLGTIGTVLVSNGAGAAVWDTLNTVTNYGSGNDTEVAIWTAADTLTGYSTFTFNGTNLIGSVPGYVLFDGDVQTSIQSDSGNIILKSHFQEVGKQSIIEIADNEIVINADSIQVLGGIPGAPDSLLGIAGTLLRFASLADINAGASIDSISYYGDTLRIYEGGSPIPFEAEMIMGVSTDTSGYNISFTRSADTLFIQDGDSTLFVVLPQGQVDTDDQTLSISNDTLYISEGNDVYLGGYLDNTDTSGYNLSLTIVTDSLKITDGDSTLAVDLSPYLDDTDTDNQTLSISNDTLYIEDGNDVYLGGYLDNTDTSGYNISFTRSNDTLRIQDANGTLFTVLPAMTVDTDNQTLDTALIVNDTLRLSLADDGEPFKAIPLGGYLDNTDTSGYNLSLTIASDSLKVTDGDGTLAVDLSGYLDNTDSQTLSISNDSLSISGGNTVVLTGLNDGNGIYSGDGTLPIGGTTVNLNGEGLILDDYNDGSFEIYLIDTNQTPPLNTSWTTFNDNQFYVKVGKITGGIFTSIESSPDDILLFRDSIGVTKDHHIKVSPTGISIGDGTTGTPTASVDVNGDLRVRTTIQNDTLSKIAALDYTTGLVKWRNASTLAGVDTDNQTIDTFDIATNTLRLSLQDDGQAYKSVSLTPYLDNTDDQTIDTFSLTGSTLNLSLEADGQAKKTVNLSGLSDGNGIISALPAGNVSINADTNSLTISNLNTLFLNTTGSRGLEFGYGYQDNYVELYTLGAGGQTLGDLYMDTTGYVFLQNRLDGLQNQIGFEGRGMSVKPGLKIALNSSLPNPGDILVASGDRAFIFADPDTLTLDDNQTIDTFAIVSNTLRLSLEDDAQAFKSVNLAGYLDDTDNQQVDTFSFSGNTLTLALQDDGEAPYTVNLGILNDSLKWDAINRCGFKDITQTNIAFDESTKIFTLTPVSGTWQYFRKGRLLTVSGAKSVDLDTLSTTLNDGDFVYIVINNNSGNLEISETIWTLLDSSLPVAMIVWNSTLYPKYHMADERHQALIDRRVHAYLHLTQGVKVLSGGVPGDYDIAPVAPTNDGNTFSVTQTDLVEEDLFETIDPLADPAGNNGEGTYVNFFHSAGNWVWDTSDMPFVFVAGSWIRYDNGTNLATGQNNKFYNYYLLYTNFDSLDAYAMIPGRSEFGTSTAAYAENPLLFDWTGFPFKECVVAYQFTFETNNSYTNKGKCRLTRAPQRINTTVTGVTVPMGIVYTDSPITGAGTVGSPIDIADGDYSDIDISGTTWTVDTSAVGTLEVTDNTLTATDLAVNVVSSVDGVTNDGGDIDLVQGSNITITPNDGANTITIAATDTDNQKIDTLSLTGSTLNLSLEDDGEAKKTVDLSGLSDGNGIYSGSGTLAGYTSVDMNGNSMDILNLNSNGDYFQIVFDSLGGNTRFTELYQDEDRFYFSAKDTIGTPDKQSYLQMYPYAATYSARRHEFLKAGLTNLDVRMDDLPQNDTLSKIAALDYTTGQIKWRNASTLAGVDTDNQQLDTAAITNDTLRLSLTDDGQPAKVLNLKPYLDDTDTNIYNTDGTLTANRILNGNNRTLTLDSLFEFAVFVKEGNSINMYSRGRNSVPSVQTYYSYSPDETDYAFMDIDGGQNGTSTQHVTIGAIAESTGRTIEVGPAYTALTGITKNDTISKVAVLGYTTGDIYWRDASTLAGTDTDNQQLDTAAITNDTLRLSLTDDAQPAKVLNLKPYLDNTDNQQVDTFTFAANTLTLALEGDGETPYTVDLSSLEDVDTDNQKADTFAIVANTLRLSLEDDGEAFKSVSLSPYLDNTDDQTIDTFSISGATLSLSLEADGQAKKTVNLSGLDVDFAANGLTMSGDSTILGGTLNKNTTIATAGYTLTVSGNKNGGILNASNANGTATSSAVYGSSGSGIGVRGDGNYGGYFTSSGTYGVYAQQSSGTAIYATGAKAAQLWGSSSTDPALGVSTLDAAAAANFMVGAGLSDTTSVLKNIILSRSSIFPSRPKAGYGSSISFDGLALTDSATYATQNSDMLSLETSWTNYYTNTSTSKFDVKLRNNNSLVRRLSLAGNGKLTLDGYATWASFQNDTISRILGVEPDGDIVWADAATLGVSGGLIDSVSYYGDTLRVYEDGNGTYPFEVEIVAGVGSDDQTVDTFAIVSDTLRLSLESDGEPYKFVDLSGYLDNTDTSGYNLSMTIATDSLKITDGDGTLAVDLSPYLDDTDTDNQTIDTASITSDTLRLSLQDDGQPAKVLNLKPYLDNTDDQQVDTFTFAANTLTLALEGDGESPYTVDLSSLEDVDTDNQTIDTFAVVANTLRLSLQDDGQAFKSVDLSSYLDNTDDQTIDTISFSADTLRVSLEADAQAQKKVDLSGLANMTVTAAPGDHIGSGMKITLTANENQAFGDVCYINSDGEAQLGDADTITTASCIAMCMQTATANNPATYLLMGTARDDTWNWTVGGTIYLSTTGTTGNTLTQTPPSGVNDVIQIIGIATHGDRMYFKPELVQIEYQP